MLFFAVKMKIWFGMVNGYFTKIVWLDTVFSYVKLLSVYVDAVDKVIFAFLARYRCLIARFYFLELLRIAVLYLYVVFCRYYQ